ncbi:AAA family ATPase [Streptomyces luteogriseus]|uniref:AAA family ATPase n=1 Tax=Streptomyces luteogriseus TaxID=68233 RepID=UPI0037F90345
MERSSVPGPTVCCAAASSRERPPSTSRTYPAGSDRNTQRERQPFMTTQDRTTVLLLTGAPGVGKTEVSRRLVGRLPGRVALIDLDAIAAIHPWRADDTLFDLMSGNLTALLPAYLSWGADYIVVAGVVVPGMVYDRLHGLFTDERLQWRIYGLRAGPTALAERIRRDTKYQDGEARMADSGLDSLVGAIPGVIQIDTDGLTLAGVVNRITRHEQEFVRP